MNAAVKNQFQFVQKKPDLIELKAIPKDASFGPAEEEFIYDAVRKNLDGSKANINVVGTWRPVRYAAVCNQSREAARQTGIVLA